MLQKLMSRISISLLAVYYLLMDEEEGKRVEFDVEVLEVIIWFVREECKEGFEMEVERWGMNGAWCVDKGVPPKPMVMSTDPVEVKMIEGEKRVQARLELPTLDIWISFSTDKPEKEVEEFREVVKSYILKVECGKYEKFLSG
jgi:hypothetical protein